MLAKYSLFIALWVINWNIAIGQPTVQTPVSFDSVINEFEKMTREDLIHGGSVSVAISYKDQIVWAKAFGFSDQQTKKPADTSTIYRIGSITKSFTAILMMKLAEKGVIKLTDPVELYLPEIKNVKGYREDHKINFRQLANHTSGLERGPEAKDAAKGEFDEWESRVLKAIASTSVKSTPGEKFQYSNIGYAFLALALSRAAKQPYSNLVEQYIFIPLQMQSSYFVVPTDKKSLIAKRLRRDSTGVFVDDPPGEQHFDFGYLVPCGGIFSTAPDLLKFAIANLGFYSLINSEDRGMMQSPINEMRTTSFVQKTTLGMISPFLPVGAREGLTLLRHCSYGLGFMIYHTRKRKIVGHGGLLGSYVSSLYSEEASGFSVAILCNCNNHRTEGDCIQLLSKLKNSQLPLQLSYLSSGKGYLKLFLIDPVVLMRDAVIL